MLREPAKRNLWKRFEEFRLKEGHEFVALSFYDCNVIPANIIVKADSKFLPRPEFDSDKYDMVMVDSITGVLVLGFGVFWAVVFLGWLLVLCCRCCFGKRRNRQRKPKLLEKVELGDPSKSEVPPRSRTW